MLLVLVWLSLRRRRRRCWEASPRRDHRPGGIAGGHDARPRAILLHLWQAPARRRQVVLRLSGGATCERNPITVWSVCVRWRMRTSREAAIARAGHLPFGRRRAWRARSDGPDASVGVVRAGCAPWWRHQLLRARRARRCAARPRRARSWRWRAVESRSRPKRRHLHVRPRFRHCDP